MTASLARTKPPRLCYRAVEFRAANPDAVSDGRTLEGYAAVFDTPTEIDSWEGSFNEVIARGAFKRSINARTPVLQFDHGRDARTGSVPIGAIQTLREDKTGLYVSARLFDNDVVEPIRQAIEGKAIDGMSFRFRVVRDTWTDSKGKQVDGSELENLLWSPGDRGPLTRTIQEVELFELGPVVFPAYSATSVGVRSMLAGLDDESREHLVRELIGMLRDAPTPPAVPDDPAVADSGEHESEPIEPPEETPDDDEAPRESEGLSDTQPEPADDGTPGETNSTTQEPAEPGTSAPTEPASRTSAYLGSTSDWYLPTPTN